MVAVINSPQKSVTKFTLSFSNRNPPTSEPIRPTIKLRIRPWGALTIFAASQPATSPTMIPLLAFRDLGGQMFRTRP
jgi:hypothetical protein